MQVNKKNSANKSIMREKNLLCSSHIGKSFYEPPRRKDTKFFAKKSETKLAVELCASVVKISSPDFWMPRG